MLTILQTVGRRGALCQCSICAVSYPVTDRFNASKTLAADQCPACRSLPNNPPTQELLQQVFDYNPLTGLLTYKRDFNRRSAGTDPTTTATNAYLVMTLDKTYLAHRMIWLRQTGDLPEFVDHKNHIRSDNRWDNLRLIDRQGNAQNKSINKNNTTGYLGVSPFRNGFRASITLDSKHVHLGVFDTPEEANAVRLAACLKHGFHENHGMS